MDETLVEGDCAGGGMDGLQGWQVLYTPGHAVDHVALYNREHRSLIAGDMVAGLGTILVSPPDGHMGTYLAQLERLIALGVSSVVPAHGAVCRGDGALLRRTLSHRRMREARVHALLDVRGRSVAEIREGAYGPLPEFMWAVATQSTLAHLIHLEEQGRAEPTPDQGWRLPEC